jgi:hypothetical protein
LTKMLKADGLDDAIIGIAHRCGEPSVVVYDIQKSLEILQKNLDCEIWEAIEYMNFNVMGAYMGSYTPIFLEKVSGIEGLKEWIEHNED